MSRYPLSLAPWRTRKRGSSGSSGVFRAASRPPVRPGRTSARDPHHAAIATESLSQAVCFNPQGLTAREAAHVAVAIKWPRAVGIIETRGPKPNAVACPRGVAFCAASRRCQHVSIAAVAAVPLVRSRGRPMPYEPMERSSWRAAQATRRIFASWGVRHPGVGSSECVGIYRRSPPLLTRPPRESIESLRLGSPRRARGAETGALPPRPVTPEATKLVEIRTQTAATTKRR